MGAPALAKVLGQGAATLAPLPFIAVVGGIMFGLDFAHSALVGLALLCALPALALIAGFAGALAAASAMDAQRKGSILNVAPLQDYHS